MLNLFTKYNFYDQANNKYMYYKSNLIEKQQMAITSKTTAIHITYRQTERRTDIYTDITPTL